MSEYEIGKDVGELFARVKALEERDRRWTCEGIMERELLVRPLTQEETEVDRKRKEKGKYCVYFVGGFVGKPCPGIKIGDFICVTPCPPCPDLSRLRVVDAKGNKICTLIVRWGAAGGCDNCPEDGHLFTWV